MMGLVEMGVGLIPGGGGTKEMALCLKLYQGIFKPFNSRVIFKCRMAKVSTSAHEAMDLGLLEKE